METITFPITENNASNRALLEQGRKYLVIYRRVGSPTNRMAAAKFDNGNFVFGSQQFVTPSSTPKLTVENDKLSPLICGWARITNYSIM